MGVIDKAVDRKFLDFQKDVSRTWPDTNDITRELKTVSQGLIANSTNIDQQFELFCKFNELLQVANITETLGDIFYYMAKLMDVFKISLTDIINNNMEKRKDLIKEDFRYKIYLREEKELSK